MIVRGAAFLIFWFLVCALCSGAVVLVWRGWLCSSCFLGVVSPWWLGVGVGRVVFGGGAFPGVLVGAFLMFLGCFRRCLFVGVGAFLVLGAFGVVIVFLCAGARSWARCPGAGECCARSWFSGVVCTGLFFLGLSCVGCHFSACRFVFVWACDYNGWYRWNRLEPYRRYGDGKPGRFAYERARESCAKTLVVR